MPTYEYECQACGHRMEAFQSIKDNPLRKCPECKRLKLRRMISAGAGLIFKGSGFYITDYRSDSYKKARESDSTSSAPPSESSSESSSGSKDEAKAPKADNKPAPKAEKGGKGDSKGSGGAGKSSASSSGSSRKASRKADK